MGNQIATTVIGNIDIKRADNFWRRLKGLLGKKSLSANAALLITPCNSVHTFAMRFSIRLICIDKQGKIIQVVNELSPNRIFVAHRDTYEILEFSTQTLPIDESLVGAVFYL
ncbi:hypothetical protein MBO_02882 [Moraxella bovoculi 237]|uniref:DUF192 domain-containing protein n=1 Tax=Moraxella bovoculi 237 TaxID=743974 RepID=A0A066UEW9_9GAMM|nr:DUF192 domain-containing protein [Moraxella bovoculi]KDN25630.1 hypothetical protein MBO_02882 [Moraxella bovoculi 237]